MKTGLFLDLDGTLLNDDYTISRLNKQAIKRAQKAGWKVYIATGKAYTIATKYAAELKLGTSSITSQGQIIIDYPFKVIRLITQDFGYTKKILKSKIVAGLIKNWTLETVDSFWVKKKENNETLSLINDPDKNVNVYSKELETELLHSAIIGAYFDIEKQNEKDVKYLIKELNKEFPTKEFQYWYTEHDFTTITIKPKIANKWKAIDKVKDYDGLDRIISMGNGWSDKEMIINANIGIAMKNSLPAVQKLANYVSEFDNNNSGVGHEIIKILESDKKRKS